jgi:Spy/CpxP family protein refolding chaperone
MSKNFPITILLLAFAAGLMFVGPTSFAQAAAPVAQGQGGMAGGSGMGQMTPENRLKWMTEKLNLTDDQQAKIKPLLEDETTQMKAVRSDTSLSPQDRHAKMKSINAASTEKINAILTPEQQTKWKEMKQEMMEKHKEMKGQGGMAPPQ